MPFCWFIIHACIPKHSSTLVWSLLNLIDLHPTFPFLAVYLSKATFTCDVFHTIDFGSYIFLVPFFIALCSLQCQKMSTWNQIDKNLIHPFSRAKQWFVLAISLGVCFLLFLKHFKGEGGCFSCTHACEPHTCLVSTQDRKGHQIPCDSCFTKCLCSWLSWNREIIS